MKFIFKVVVVLILLVVVAVVALVFYIDAIARAGVEKGATYVLGVETKVDKADVGILSGSFAMSGLNVANPQGFDSPHFLHLDDSNVKVSLGTLREEVVELPELNMTGLDVHLEKSGDKSNYNVILDNLKKFESGEKKEPEPGGKKFVIRKVSLKDVNVHVDMAPIGGDLTKIDVPIDEIQLTNVGSGSGKGVPMGELSGVLVKAIFAAIVAKGGGLIPEDILSDLTNGLNQLTSLGDLGIGVVAGASGSLESVIGGLGKAVEDVTGGLGDVGEGIGKSAEDALKGIGDILGGKKDDEKKDDE